MISYLVALLRIRHFLTGLLGTLALTVYGQQQKTLINDQWEYLANNTPQYEGARQQAGWQPVTLPHSWNTWDATDATPGYRRDRSWYRRDISLSPSESKAYALYFEGANLVTDVFVNGQRAGGHVGGYVGFTVDITPFLTEGSNEVYVSVDNRYDPTIIPSHKADFFIFGGLIRDVWLLRHPRQRITQLQVSTPEVSKQAATTQVAVSFNHIPSGNLKIVLRDSAGVVQQEQSVVLSSDSTQQFTLPSLANPALWSPDHPTRYRLRVTYQGQRGTLRDERQQTIGYRFFAFEPHGPFLLNGDTLKLRGTHLHEEYAGYGAAMPDSLRVKDLVTIKAMGANFVRLAHYPQDPSVYHACDSLGLIVWDELPWCRGGLGDARWKATTKRLLEEQIRQNYHHPSILFWSLGNEVYWLPDFAGGDDRDRINAFLEELNTLAHQLDSDRLTAIRKYYAGSDIVDVFSPSIWAGWYGGAYQQYEAALQEARPKYPRFLHAEYGGSSHRGRHVKEPYQVEVGPDASVEELVNQATVKNVSRYGDWSENYINDLFDWHLGISEKLPWFAGNLQWAFKDFGTPLRPENAIPYINQKGLVDRAGTPKDAYYIFQSYWASEPMVYLEGRTWTERQGGAQEVHPIKVYSNAHRVTLTLNGQVLESKQRDPEAFPAQGLVWDVVLSTGKNTLAATGYSAQGAPTGHDTLMVRYDTIRAGSPEQVRWNDKVLPNGNVLVTATMRDAAGRRCLDYQERVYFDLLGGGELLSAYGVMGRSVVIEMANGQASIEVIPSPSGPATLELRGQDFKGAYYQVRKADP